MGMLRASGPRISTKRQETAATKIGIHKNSSSDASMVLALSFWTSTPNPPYSVVCFRISWRGMSTKTVAPMQSRQSRAETCTDSKSQAFLQCLARARAFSTFSFKPSPPFAATCAFKAWHKNIQKGHHQWHPTEKLSKKLERCCVKVLIITYKIL